MTEQRTTTHREPEGRALIYCEGAFGSTHGKTAHGLVRRSRRYEVLAVIDSQRAGEDAGALLDGLSRGIPIYPSLREALARGEAATHLVIGLAPDGGRLPRDARDTILEAISSGLHVDSGLHDLLTEDHEIVAAAARSGVRLRDVRKLPPRSELHFFSGAIEGVTSLKVALLGTDSAVGKRTTAWLLLDALQRHEVNAALVGTGQTAWMQGASHGIILDALINDFVSGELEHAIVGCHRDLSPEVIIIEGQGSLMNPAYPGGLEILAAGRPDLVILQHAPARRYYDGFPAHPLHPLSQQIEAIELLSGKPVVAITVNGEQLDEQRLQQACRELAVATRRLVCVPLADGLEPLASLLIERLGRHRERLNA